jgi:hypothetical protein
LLGAPIARCRALGAQWTVSLAVRRVVVSPVSVALIVIGSSPAWCCLALPASVLVAISSGAVIVTRAFVRAVSGAIVSAWWWSLAVSLVCLIVMCLAARLPAAKLRPWGRVIAIVFRAGAPAPAVSVNDSFGLCFATPVSDAWVTVGGPAGVTAFDGADGGPVPAWLVAVAVNV